MPCFLEKKDLIQAFHLDNQNVTGPQMSSKPTLSFSGGGIRGLVCKRRSQAGQGCCLSVEGTPFYARAPSLRRGAGGTFWEHE